MYRHHLHWLLWVFALLICALQLPLNEAVQRKESPVSLKNLAQEELSEPRDNWLFLELSNEKVVRWNSHLLLPDTSINASYFLQKTPTHWYVVERTKDRYAFYPVLKKTANAYYSEQRGKNFKLKLPLDLRDNRVLTGEEAERVELQLIHKGRSWSLLVLSFFLILFVLSLWRFAVKGSKWVNLFALLFVLSSLLLRWLLYKRLIFNPLFDLTVFDPVIYASNQFLPSLGDLLLHVLTALLILETIYQWMLKTKRNLPLVVLVIVLLFLTDLITDLIKGMVMDSSISFELMNFTNLSSLSFLSILLASGLLILSFVYGRRFFARVKLKKRGKRFWLELILGLSFFWAFQLWDSGKHLDELLRSAAIFCALAFIIGQPGLTFRIQLGLGILLSVGVSAWLIQKYQVQHEKEFLKIYASKLTSSHDLESEYILKQIENPLVEEFLEPTDYENYIIQRERFESRLRQLYFSGYLDKYDVQFFSFDANGQNLNGNELYNRNVLNEVYNFETYPALGNYFYRIKSPSQLSGYIAKFENCDLEGSFGETFILLQPKFIQRAYFYPPFLENKSLAQPFDFNHYSYAVYSSEKLARQKGDYPYPLQLDPGSFEHDRNDAWHHFVSVENPWTIVVISKEYGAVYQLISMVSLILLLVFSLVTVLIGLLLLLRWLQKRLWPGKDIKWLNVPGNTELLRSRIRVAMVFLAIAGLLLSVIFNINFMSRQNRERERLLLTNKLRDVALQMQNRLDVSGELWNEEKLQVEINEIAEAQKTDLNLFDTSGILLASTKKQVFDEDYLAPLMNIKALEMMKSRHLSQYIHTESIGNNSFLAAYMPLFDGNRRVTAFINVPFFSESHTLKKELSGFITTLINVYVLLILLSFALASLISRRITQPLLLLKNKLSAIKFGQPNEPIEWSQNDEIGELVKEYNHTLMKLEESARLLARSEREGAWKEMAKQVAHEIKNPLTPMKLNIQHLQRAWNDQHPKLDEMFSKLTRVLIEQIESLSTLATEFSSFAKMPAGKPENCNLSELVQQTALLYAETETADISVDLPEGETLIYADPEQMSRVLTNIIKNALQSIPDHRKGIIDIRLKAEDRHHWLLSVQDNGTGIPSELQDKIFVPNFSTKNSGMGLGLAISKKVIDNFQGDIWFETKEHEGTTFFIRLPKVKV